MRVMHDAKSAIRHVSRAGVGLSVVYVYLIFMFVGVEIEFQRDRLGTDDLLDLYLTSSDGSFLIQPSHDRRTSKTLMSMYSTCADLQQWKHFIISLRFRGMCKEGFFLSLSFCLPLMESNVFFQKYLRTPWGKCLFTDTTEMFRCLFLSTDFTLD